MPAGPRQGLLSPLLATGTYWGPHVCLRADDTPGMRREVRHCGVSRTRQVRAEGAGHPIPGPSCLLSLPPVSLQEEPGVNAAVASPKEEQEEPRGEEQDAAEDGEQDLEKVGAWCAGSGLGEVLARHPGPTEGGRWGLLTVASCRCVCGVLLPHGTVGL